MIGIFCFVLAILAPPFKSKSRLEAENAVLGHQLVVLRRKTHGRPRLTNNDRWLFILMYRWCPAILQALTIIRPEMLVRWHRGRLSSLLALEVAPTGRAAADRSRTARGDPAVLRRKSPQRLTFTSIDRLVFAGWSRALWVLGLTSAPALISLVHHFRTTGGRMEASQRKGPDGRRGTRCVQ